MCRRVVERVLQAFRVIVVLLSARSLQSKKKGLIYPEDEGSTILRNIDNLHPKIRRHTTEKFCVALLFRHFPARQDSG